MNNPDSAFSASSAAPAPARPHPIARLGWPDRLLILGFCTLQVLLAAAVLLVGYKFYVASRASAPQAAEARAAALPAPPPPLADAASAADSSSPDTAPLCDGASTSRVHLPSSPEAVIHPQARSSLPPGSDAPSPFSPAAVAPGPAPSSSPDESPAAAPSPAPTASAATDAADEEAPVPDLDPFDNPVPSPFDDPFADSFFAPSPFFQTGFRAPPAFFAPDPVATMARATLQDMRSLFDADPAWASSPARPATSMTSLPDRYEITLDRVDPDALDISLDGRMLSIAYKQAERSSNLYAASSMAARFLLPGPVADHDALRTTADPDNHRVTIAVYKPGATPTAATAPTPLKP